MEDPFRGKYEDPLWNKAIVGVLIVVGIIVGIMMLARGSGSSPADYGVDYYDVCGTSRGC